MTAPSGLEMMLGSLIKKAGIDPQQVMQVVEGIGRTMKSTNDLMVKADERLAKIETLALETRELLRMYHSEHRLSAGRTGTGMLVGASHGTGGDHGAAL